MNTNQSSSLVDRFQNNPQVKQYRRRSDAFVATDEEIEAVDHFYPETVRAVRQADFDTFEIQCVALICTTKILVGSTEGAEDEYLLAISYQPLEDGGASVSDPEYEEFAEIAFPDRWRAFIDELDCFLKATIMAVQPYGEQFILSVTFEDNTWNEVLGAVHGLVVLPAFYFPYGELTKVTLKDDIIRWEWRLRQGDYLVMHDNKTLRRVAKEMFEMIYELIE